MSGLVSSIGAAEGLEIGSERHEHLRRTTLNEYSDQHSRYVHPRGTWIGTRQTIDFGNIEEC